MTKTTTEETKTLSLCKASPIALSRPSPPSWAAASRSDPKSAHEGRKERPTGEGPAFSLLGEVLYPPPPPPAHLGRHRTPGERSLSRPSRLKTVSKRLQHGKTRQDGFKKAPGRLRDAFRGQLGPNLDPIEGPKIMVFLSFLKVFLISTIFR